MSDNIDPVGLSAELLALHIVVRLLVVNAWGHKPELIREFRETALSSVSSSLAKLEAADNSEEFEKSVRAEIASLLADPPEDFGKER